MTAATTSRAAVEPGRSGYAWSAVGAVLAVVLVFDGLLSVVLEILYLPVYIGTTAFPIAALVAAIVNVALVRGMRVLVSRPAAMALPVLAWLFGFLICATTGPGGDILLVDKWTAPLLLACGVVPVGFYLFRQAFGRPRDSASAR